MTGLVVTIFAGFLVCDLELGHDLHLLKTSLMACNSLLELLLVLFLQPIFDLSFKVGFDFLLEFFGHLILDLPTQFLLNLDRKALGQIHH